MNIEHQQDKKRFCVFNDAGEQMGLIEYLPAGGGDIYATHTEVFPAYEGRGVAAQLLDAMVAYAKENDLKIVPMCGYVVRSFEKNPEKYAEVIK